MFQKTRLKLTAWYLLIIMVISISFSLVIYRMLERELDRFADSQKFKIELVLKANARNFFPPPPKIEIDKQLVKETKTRIVIYLLFINSGIFIISGFFGFLLAGKTLKPIKEMIDEQNRFIADASHELNTPLSVLKTSMEVSLRDNSIDKNEYKNVLKDNLDEVNRLQKLTEGLLKINSNENDQINSELNLVSKSINYAIKKIQNLADKKNIKIKINLKQDFKIKSDINELIELFIIFLDNAIKYSKEGTKVLVSIYSDNKFNIVEIKDNGIGINEKDLPHIFDRFYRVDKSRNKNQINGYGLGLSIAQKIINKYKGVIEVKSVLNKGTVFIIKFPKH